MATPLSSAPVLAFGAFTRTGSVTLIALRATSGEPEFAGRWEAPLVPADLPAQPYHAAAGLAPEAAEELVGRGEAAAEEAALAALRGAVAEPALPPAADVLARLGLAAGRPWRRAEKDAARAALTLLPPA